MKEIEARMIKLAAEILRRPNMPDASLMPWPKRHSKKMARAIRHAEEDASEQCRLWAIELKRIADDIRASRIGECICPKCGLRHGMSATTSTEF